MVFMQIAVSAIGIGIVVMVGYLVIAQVRSSLPIAGLRIPYTNASGYVFYDTTQEIAVNTSLNNAQTTIFAGFALVAVGIIVLAAFGMISVFQ
jgi:hypothetical protein